MNPCELNEIAKKLYEGIQNGECEFAVKTDSNDPYLVSINVKTVLKYNPKYGDEKICKCGHPYYRHFDTYDEMFACGCKYCQCLEFKKKN